MIVRRVARYLLLADLLSWVFVITVESYSPQSAIGPAATVEAALWYTLPILVVLSLVQVVTSRIRRETTVAVGAECVFGLLVDPLAWVRLSGSWLGRYRRIDGVETAASGGTKGQATLTALGLPRVMRWVTLEYRPPHSVVIFARTKWIGIPSLHLANWSLEPTGKDTRVRLDQESRNLGLIPAGVFSRRMLGRTVDRLLTRLQIEAEATRSP